jgi:formylglycine-generating enzyme required for sulfatase activity
MDERLRELERVADGDVEARWKLVFQRYGAQGEWVCGAAGEEVEQSPYLEALEWAQGQGGFELLDVQSYACGGQRNDVARFRHLATALMFCLIPGGRFRMGSPEDFAGQLSESPQHEVRLRPFLLCQTPCTQAAYEQVMGENPSAFKGEPVRPAGSVAWDNAQEFCERAELSLPSEAQWEYACRAGTETTFCFGDDEAKLADYAWCSKSPSYVTQPVGDKLPNAFGLYDVHGSVHEWCQDLKHWGYEGAPADGSAWEDPALGLRGLVTDRIVRGGMWMQDASYLRSARRGGLPPDFDGEAAGFRPARSP